MSMCAKARGPKIKKEKLDIDFVPKDGYIKDMKIKLSLKDVVNGIRKPMPPPTVRHRDAKQYNRRNQSWRNE